MSGSEPATGDVFELDRIRRLIELMKEHDLSEIDLKQGDQQIRVCRGDRGTPVVYGGMAGPSGAIGASGASAATGGRTDGGPTPDDSRIVMIKSPMVGTFYARPNPNAEPFVKVGDHVEPGTTVCIIEAMKMFNEIPAEVSGQIVAVLVQNEEPVDYDRPLFKVDTSR